MKTVYAHGSPAAWLDHVQRWLDVLPDGGVAVLLGLILAAALASLLSR